MRNLINQYYTCLVVFATLIMVSTSCVSPDKSFTRLPPGMWRGVLFLDGEIPPSAGNEEFIKVEQNTGELPFNFEVVYDNKDKFHIVIHNGEERIKIDDITYGVDKATAKDTVKINFTEYDTYISALFEEKLMEGYFYVNYKQGYRIKFKAYYGDNRRFKIDTTARVEDFSGRYATKFSPGDSTKEYPGVGVFTQVGKKLTGTFLTETGDYRYLEGHVQNNKAMLSAFDGAHAFLFELKKTDANTIIGEFRSGTSHREPFEAIRDNNAKLSDAYSLVKIADSKPISLKLMNNKGKIIDTNAPEHNDKIKIYEVMGTWCPNCGDATDFLKDFQKNNTNVVVTALAFERYKDSTRAIQIIDKYATKKQLNYEILLGGYYDKKGVAAVIPQMEKLKAYPTILIADRNNVVRKIYTGFYGPATKEYATFKENFNKVIHELSKS
jgi:thiol-disulfide isomerase/thioredoxin